MTQETDVIAKSASDAAISIGPARMQLDDALALQAGRVKKACFLAANEGLVAQLS